MPPWLANFLKQNGVTLALFAVFGWYVYTHEGGGISAPEAPVTVAARNYLVNLPKSYAAVKQGVLGGSIKTEADLINAANAGAAEPMANAFHAAIAPGVDTKTGAIINAALVAQAIDDLLKGLK